MWSFKEIAGSPINRKLYCLDYDALATGCIKFNEEIIKERGFDKIPGYNMKAYAPPLQVAMRLAFMLYAAKFLNDSWVKEDLVKAANLYPFTEIPYDRLDQHIGLWELHENGWISPPKVQLNYREVIYHICARGRMGETWPNALHASVITYLAWGFFDPVLVNRAIDPKEGSLDGYYVIPGTYMETPNGKQLVKLAGQTKREAISGHDKRTRDLIVGNWNEIKHAERNSIGHERLRGPGLVSIETWTCWLFRRHFLRESYESIAEGQYGIDYVEERVKRLRQALELQPKNAVKCKHKITSPYYGAKLND